PAELGIYCQARTTAGANHLHGRTLVMAHHNLKLCSRENKAQDVKEATLSAAAQPARWSPRVHSSVRRHPCPTPSYALKTAHVNSDLRICQELSTAVEAQRRA